MVLVNGYHIVPNNHKWNIILRVEVTKGPGVDGLWPIKEVGGLLTGDRVKRERTHQVGLEG